MHIQILCRLRRVERGENQTDAIDMLGKGLSGVVILIETLETSMSKASYHSPVVKCKLTFVK